MVTWVPDPPRTFNLGLRSRTVDHKAKTVTLELASDEALLIDYATLVEDLYAVGHPGSLRTIVNHVLGTVIPGTALVAGPDAAIPAEAAAEALIWRPGTTAWDFLAPLTTVCGLRLFCDETRTWRLIDPSGGVPGYLPISPTNTVQGADTISRDDPEVFATGVVVRNLWEDSAGVAQTAYDVAGTPEKVVVIEYRRPYPGPGTAAAILGRRSGTGRTQDVQGLARWAATPGMTATVTLPGAGEQQGKVITVTWAIDDTSLMSVGTRGLIDIPSGAWLDWDPTEAWQDVDAAITWASL